jgi:arylsulfatase A-like enzyme
MTSQRLILRPKPIGPHWRFLFTLAMVMLLVQTVTTSPAYSAEATRPNILVIVADDLGYGDLGFQGGKEIPTPNLDRLARTGTRLTNGYVSCPVCSPTRAGLSTGRYQQRFGHELNPGPARGADDQEFGLPLSEITLASLFQKGGYHTGLVGKWHLGFAPQFHPQERGYDEFYGFLGGAHTYTGEAKQPRTGIYRGKEKIQSPEYLTDAFGVEASSFIERNAAQPFLLFVTFNAVHTPLQATAAKLDQFKGITDPKRHPYAGMLSSLDDAAGKILDQLDKSHVAENTLVVFISDNGGPTQANGSLNTPLQGVKATVWEGGIRVPFVIRWPGHVPADKTYAAPAISLDIFSTTLAAAGIAAPSDRTIDGVNLLPYLNGTQTGAPHSTLFWRFGEQQAIRKGNYKLLRLRSGEEHLFDLGSDIGEKQDLLAQKPEVLKELRDDYARWNAELQEPRWKPQQAVRRNAAKNKSN